MNEHFDWFRLGQVLTYMALSKNVIVTKCDAGLHIEAGCFRPTSQLPDAIADEENRLYPKPGITPLIGVIDANLF